MADDTTKTAAPAKATFSTESPLNKPEVEVNKYVTAPNGPGPSHAPQGMRVHEVRVNIDRVITDPTDPLAVQVPADNFETAITPLGRVWGEGTPEHVETVFAREASKKS